MIISLKGKKIAKIGNPRNESMSREVFRHEEFVNDVVLQRVRDHFICKFIYFILHIFKIKQKIKNKNK